MFENSVWDNGKTYELLVLFEKLVYVCTIRGKTWAFEMAAANWMISSISAHETLSPPPPLTSSDQSVVMN